MTEYAAKVRQVADNTGRALVEVHRTLPEAERFLLHGAFTLATGWRVGTDLGTLAARSAMEVALKGPALVVVVPDHLQPPVEKMQKALGTILLGDGHIDEQLLRLALGEVTEASADAMIRQYDYHRQYRGYKRILSPGACELCTYWARGGATLRGAMPRHPGCTCSAEPVMRKEQEDGRTASFGRELAGAAGRQAIVSGSGVAAHGFAALAARYA